MGGTGGKPLRALVVRDGRLVIEERATPEVVADRVLVKVAGAGLNRADLLQRIGGHPAPPGWPPDILGLEFAGTVAAVGDDVRDLRQGDRVFGIVGGGAQATLVLTREELCVRVPDSLDLVAAGGVPEVFITAHDALVTLAELRPGDRVLIHGVGSGVGTAAVQITRAIGATSVGTSRTEEKLQRCKQLGLDEGVLAETDMAKRIGEVDVVLDLIGGAYLATDVEVCRPTGRIVLVGLVAGNSATLDLGAVLRKRIRLMGTVLRSRPEHEKAAATAAFRREVAPLLAAGTLRPIIDRTYPL
ncbi:MAG: NAD(P)H-quinone oxidoreductase, partial [Actinomycetota bacterium]